MGYDISFHPISEKQMQEWYFDVIDDFDKAREIAKIYNIDEETDDFYENKYIEILGFGKEATNEKSFENTHGYYIANIQGIFQKFFYVRGASFSFIDDPAMDKYYKKWEEFIPDKYKAYTIYNEIQNNYYSGKFIPHDKVCQLLEDYKYNEEIKSILNEQFSYQRIEVLIDALNFAKEHGLGLLEADGVMEPNPLDLNDSSCFSNLFHCDIKGPLLYEEAAMEQINEFKKVEGINKGSSEITKEIIHIEDEDDDDYYSADELWYDEEEYDSYDAEGIELYGLNELDELIEEMESHTIVTDVWHKQLMSLFSSKKIKKASVIIVKVQMLLDHHDFENITILDKKETEEYATELVSLCTESYKSYFEMTEVTSWYDDLIIHLQNLEDTPQKEEITEAISEIAAKLKPHRKELIRIKPITKNPLSLWSSKFGGVPYWTKDMVYPKDAKGNNLYMIAQLNFEELPHLEGYPQEGILQFFIANDDTYGLDFDRKQEEILDNPNSYKVIYHEKVLTEVALLEKELPSICDTNNMPFTKEYAVAFTKEEELPAPSDCIFEKIVGDIYNYNDDVVDALSEEIYNDGSKLGGYATFSQEDPRYGIPCKEWKLLFQLDTEDENGIEIMWGDSGVANFFIEPKHLKERDFSRVWYNWDCY